MEPIRAYLLSVITAGVICSIVTSIPGRSAAVSALLKLTTGIFMAVTVISPLISFQLPNIQSYMDAFSVDAAYAVETGQQLAAEETKKIIKSRLEAYILDKAAVFGADLTVQVSLSEEQFPVPCAVELSGQISPYGKLRLTEFLEDELGIGKEHQIWKN